MLAIRCDVSVPEDVEAAVFKTVERLGRIDCAFNNAGVENKAAPSTRSLSTNGTASSTSTCAARSCA